MAWRCKHPYTTLAHTLATTERSQVVQATVRSNKVVYNGNHRFWPKDFGGFTPQCPAH